jgi:hypothetical protein
LLKRTLMQKDGSTMPVMQGLQRKPLKGKYDRFHGARHLSFPFGDGHLEKRLVLMADVTNGTHAQ